MRGDPDVVVVSGLHRTGTTFVANLLGCADRTRLFPSEPLNVEWGLRSSRVWYPTISTGQSPGSRDVGKDLERLVRGLPVRWGYQPADTGRPWRPHLRSLRRARMAAEARLDGQTLILKDPFLSLSLQFVARRLSRRPIVVTARHPAAWAMSLERMDWHPGSLLNSLIRRPELARSVQELGIRQMDWTEVPLLDAASWAWALLTRELLQQADSTPQCLMLRLEDFADSPIDTSIRLLGAVGLAAGPQTQDRIDHLTGGSAIFPDSNEQHVLARDTKASVGAWRDRMPDRDVHRVWEITQPVAQALYSRP